VADLLWEKNTVPRLITVLISSAEQGLMSSPFMLSDSPPPSLWLPLPPAEGFAAPENFGDWQISLDA
jgi:hypothetical protein